MRALIETVTSDCRVGKAQRAHQAFGASGAFVVSTLRFAHPTTLRLVGMMLGFVITQHQPTTDAVLIANGETRGNNNE